MLKAVKEKTAKLAEIDSIETGKTVFGGKVTVSQGDWQNVTDLARKEVASQKQTKKWTIVNKVDRRREKNQKSSSN